MAISCYDFACFGQWFCMRSLYLILISAMIAMCISLAIAQTDSRKTTPTRTARPTSATPKPTVKPTPKPNSTSKTNTNAAAVNERSALEKLNAITDDTEKAAAARAFIDKFPNSRRIKQVREMIAVSELSLAETAIRNNDVATAVRLSRSAIAELPEEISGDLFSTRLAKLPLTLFFAGDQPGAIEIAKLLESRVNKSSSRLRTIAEFYLNVENGTEARRVIELSLDIEPESAATYLLLGLAERIDFRFVQSAAAFAKAIEFDPSNTDAKRGLAEIKRADGDAAGAAELYREILGSEPDNVGARNGLVLALLENGDKAGDEMLERELATTPDNVMLLGGAAYAYASRNDGERAVDYGQRAVTADPRFIWSHIALARGLLLRRDPVSAEKVLLAARRFGNFPSLDYELASVRSALGFYREAADDLARSFTYNDGTISTRLGGRVERSSTSFDDLIGHERRASIFAPTAADSPSNAATMLALLRFRSITRADQIDSGAAIAAARDLVGSADSMRMHRRLFAAQVLLEKGADAEQTLELIRGGTADIDTGLDADVPAAAILANELYESRGIAIRRGEYIRIPEVPRQTLSAVLRGRVESMSGQALAKLGRNDEAIVRFRRAVGVFPADSSWLRDANWKLGMALEAKGKESEALEAYIKSYAGGPADVFRYRLISLLYRSIKGSAEGLEERIGPDPLPQTATVATEPSRTVTPTPTPDSEYDDEPIPTPTVESSPMPTPEPTPDDDDEPKPVPTAAATPLPVSSPTPDARSRSRVVATGESCEFYVSEELMTLRSNGGGLALIVGRKDDGDITDLTVTPSNEDDILVRREMVAGVTSRAVYVISSKSGRPGLYYVRLDLPCARRDVVIQVR